MKKLTRKRKKWLKKHGMYVNERDTWNLKKNIGTYVYPRLKMFRKINDGHPVDCPEIESRAQWDEMLDKMVLAFQYLAEGDSWQATSKYCLADDIHIEEVRRIQVIDEGLELFAKYAHYLWC